MVQRDWTLCCNNCWYQLDRRHECLSLVRRKVIVRTLRSGVIQLVYRGAKLRYRRLPGRPERQTRKPTPVKAVRTSKPVTEHPWRRFASGVGQGGEYWRKAKAEGQIARQASRALRSASATLRPLSRLGRPEKVRAKHQPPTQGDIFT